jgi:ABC-2 type transport system ATP-binding protein
MMEHSIQVEALRKTYGKENLPAVDNISFTVEEGEIFGLIGPDGAGKTSIFRILTTLILPDSGKATVDGFDIITGYEEIRKTVGYMPGKFSLYQDLSVEENLSFFATIFNTTIEENYHLIKDIYEQIEPFKKRRAGKLSGGMKQKLALCCALIHQPTILFLDEPTTGVDPVSRKELWEMLKRLKAKGITIIVSTPYMDEAGLCDRIALIQNGKILSIDTPENISAAYPDPIYEVKGGKMSTLLNLLEHFKETKSAFAFGDTVHLTLKETTNGESLITAYLAEQGIEDSTIHPIKPSIEDCFIQLLKN